MTRVRLPFPIRFSAFLLLFVFVSGALGLMSQGGAPELDSSAPLLPLTVVLDPGHGGEDGGAVGASGTKEKELNLALALLLREKLEESGVQVVMTRETDTLLYDRTGNYQGQKKKQDLAARVSIAEGTPGCILVSLHMNTYPRADCRGLQVWYSQNNERSRALAEGIRAAVTAELQPENHRSIKATGSSIALLHRLHVPAVLVECGFLSNPEEEARLSDPKYREKLAECLRDAILAFKKTTE